VVLSAIPFETMEKKRVLLVCSQDLFGESMEGLLRAHEELELIGPWEQETDVCAQVPEVCPDVVVIVEPDPEHERSAALTSAIMEGFPELPVIRAGLTENFFRLFSTHLLPARESDLVDAIRGLPAWKLMPKEDETLGGTRDANQ
jgi:chemotaxis response regulator CheB